MQRARLITSLREDAAKQGRKLVVDMSKGKGSHAKVSVGGAFTFIPDRDIDPKTESKIRKTLGL